MVIVEDGLVGCGVIVLLALTPCPGDDGAGHLFVIHDRLQPINALQEVGSVRLMG